MSQSDKKFPTPATHFVDAVVVIAFFVYMFTVLRGHVPSHAPFWINFWGAAGSACMSCVFWLAVQMFRVVVRHQHELKAAKPRK